MKVKRIWHGWTTPENADTYQDLLHRVVFPGIESKNIAGFRSVEVLRRDLEDEVEFITIMTFDSIQNVIAFQGKDYEKSYVPDEAQKVLKRWNKVADHFQVIETRLYPDLS
jgi:heme-degrading monooxygenase HmoA